MPALKDARMEAFCRAVATGKTNKQAAIEAGYSGNFVSSKGSKLAKLGKVKLRIAELTSKIEQEVVERVAKAATAAHVDRELRIMEKLTRIADLQEIRDKLKQIVAERAADPKMQNVPGGKTGYLAATLKVLRTPDGFKAGYEYFLDDKLIRELKDTHKQVAIETNQWLNKEADLDERPVSSIEYRWVEPKLEDRTAAAGTKPEHEELRFDGPVQ